MRACAVLLMLLASALGCYEPTVLALLNPDDACAFSADGTVRGSGLLDVGPTEALTHSYEAMLLVDGRSGDKVTSASVAFKDAAGERLPDVEYAGRTVVFPSVEGERHSDVQGTLNDEGRAAVPFTLVTLEEAAPLQALMTPGEDLEMLIEVRAKIGGVEAFPTLVTLHVCQQCLVGVGAELEGETLVCPDGSAPARVPDEPCFAGQDHLFSSCATP